MLRAKYCSAQRIHSRNVRNLLGSRVWSAVKKGVDTFNRGAKWVVGSNSNLKFWFDHWTSEGPVRQMIQGPLSLADHQLRIRDIFKDGVWDWGCLSCVIPQHIKFVIQATLCALASSGWDRLAWSALTQDNFDLKSAYKIAMGDLHAEEFSRKWIWNIDILPRIKTFVWQCYHNSIGVKECLVRKGMLEDGSCPLCRRTPESIIHALRDCKSIKPVWIQLGVRWTDRRFWTDELHEWLELNGKKG